jgi:hypothetical protein
MYGLLALDANSHILGVDVIRIGLHSRRINA